MSDDAAKKIAQALDSYDAAKKSEVDRRAAEAQESETLIGSFKAVREDVLRPTLQRLADELNKRGHVATVSDRDGLERDVRTVAVELRIVPRGHVEAPHTGPSVPLLRYSAQERGKMVEVSGEYYMPRGGGRGGLVRSCTPASLTAGIVEEDVATLIQRTFGAYKPSSV